MTIARIRDIWRGADASERAAAGLGWLLIATMAVAVLEAF